MKTKFRLASMLGVLLIVALTVLSVGIASAAQPAAPRATKTPTPTPGGPTATPTSGVAADLVVSGTQMGVSSCYLGANEGSSDFNINDFTDLGINTYRIYGGMSRWEPVDDDGVYGSPSIAQIKADPNVINWAFWDNIMTNPPSGTDYHWSDVNGWPGNARTMFGALKTAGVKPVVVLRNVDNGGKPAWSAAFNPPTTQADWNEWWEHVFATVYWFNVRNDYQVDDWQVHNEPNNRSQGWTGTITQYYEFVRQTNDAIQYVYATYLPGRTPNVYAPGTTTGSNWPRDVMLNVGPAHFNTVDIHNYDTDITSYDQQVHGWMDLYGFANAPLWITESGTWHTNRYGNAKNVNSMFIANFIRGSMPGNNYVTGNHIFSMYDWGTYLSGFITGPGANGTKLAGYYAVRIAVRGLGPCRPTYAVTGPLLAIATKDTAGAVYLLVNGGSGTLTADLSALKMSGTGTMWKFDSTHNDVIVGNPVLSNGRVTFTAAGSGGTVLLKFP